MRPERKQKSCGQRGDEHGGLQFREACVQEEGSLDAPVITLVAEGEKSLRLWTFRTIGLRSCWMMKLAYVSTDYVDIAKAGKNGQPDRVKTQSGRF